MFPREAQGEVLIPAPSFPSRLGPMALGWPRLSHHSAERGCIASAVNAPPRYSSHHCTTPSPVCLMILTTALQLGITRHRGVMSCPGDIREQTEDPGIEFASPSSHTFSLIMQHTSWLQPRATPSASISEARGLWIRRYMVCAEPFPTKHSGSSAAHSGQQDALNREPPDHDLSRAPGITAARSSLLNTAQIRQKGCKIHSVVSVWEPGPLACK